MSRVLDVCLVVGRIYTLRLLLGPILLAFDQNGRLNHYPETLENLGIKKKNHFHCLKYKCSCQRERLKAAKLRNQHADWLANQAVIEANAWLFTFLWWFADSSVPISQAAHISSDLNVLFIIASFECLFLEASQCKSMQGTALVFFL